MGSLKGEPVPETLIIGGNGYIGSALYNAIDADSIDLCLFGTDLGYSKIDNFNDSDISGYENVILLAAHSSVPMSEYNKENAWKNNVDYFIKLCERLGDNQKLIYASSGSIYGRMSGMSVESDVNINPINQYDLTKLINDIVANKFISQGKNIIGFRFGTVNGPSKNTRADVMINMMYKTFVDTGKIFYRNPDIMRPILSINDLVSAYIKVLSSNKFISGQYNLCSFNSSVKDIVNITANKIGCQIEQLPDEPAYDFQIDNSKFCETYNFKFSESIESIVQKMIDSDNLNFSVRDNDDRFNEVV